MKFRFSEVAFGGILEPLLIAYIPYIYFAKCIKIELYSGNQYYVAVLVIIMVCTYLQICNKSTQEVDTFFIHSYYVHV